MSEKRMAGRPVTRKVSDDGAELECTSCRTMKPRGDFAGMSASRTGKSYACRSCSSARRRKYARPKPKPQERKAPAKAVSLKGGRPRTRKVLGDKLQCSSCKQLLPTASFYSSASTPTGKAYACKACTKKYRKTRYDHATREHIAQTTPVKTCVMCGQEKDHTEFTIMATAKDGLCPVCRVCISSGGQGVD